jgi:hypothetical protein
MGRRQRDDHQVEVRRAADQLRQMVAEVCAELVVNPLDHQALGCRTDEQRIRNGRRLVGDEFGEDLWLA